MLRFLGDPIAVLRSLRPYGDVVAVARDNPALVCAFGPERNREVLANPASFQHAEDLITGPDGSAMHKMSKVIMSINGEQAQAASQADAAGVQSRRARSLRARHRAGRP